MSAFNISQTIKLNFGRGHLSIWMNVGEAEYCMLCIPGAPLTRPSKEVKDSDWSLLCVVVLFFKISKTIRNEAQKRIITSGCMHFPTGPREQNTSSFQTQGRCHVVLTWAEKNLFGNTSEQSRIKSPHLRSDLICTERGAAGLWCVLAVHFFFFAGGGPWSMLADTKATTSCTKVHRAHPDDHTQTLPVHGLQVSKLRLRWALAGPLGILMKIGVSSKWREESQWVNKQMPLTQWLPAA